MTIIYSAIRWLEFIEVGTKRHITFCPRILYMVSEIISYLQIYTICHSTILGHSQLLEIYSLYR